MSAISEDMVHDVLADLDALGGQIFPFDVIADKLNDSFARAGATTHLRCLGYVSTVTMEIDCFRTTTEYNAEGKSYYPWCGRGDIQLTLKENYQHFGRWCIDQKIPGVPYVDYFADNPEKLSDPIWFWLAGIFYWRYWATYAGALKTWAPYKDCNEVADTGDYSLVAASVNGGNPHFNQSELQGLPGRKASWDAWAKYDLTPVSPIPKASDLISRIAAEPDAFTQAILRGL